MSAPLLAVRELTAGYGRGSILQGATLEVGEGEAVCVLGRNGAGKTTLVKAILGELSARSGAIALAGKDATRLRPHQIARLGVACLPQEKAVFPGLSVREHIRLSAAGEGQVADAVELMSSRFPSLAGRLDQEAQTLSGGERKMLGIVQCIARKPRLALFDEPTEGVAPVVAETLRTALATQMAGTSIVLVEQNLDTALAISTRAYVLERGAIVEEGKTADLHSAGILHERLSA